MARLPQETKDKILAEFHIGKSQNWLAKKYECSPATVNKICKGIIPKFKDKVNTVAAIKSELSKESEYQNECFNKEVNEKIRNIEIIHKMTKLNLKDLAEKIDDGLATVNDNKIAQDTIDKASITLGVNQRHANSQVHINNSNAQQNNSVNIEDMSEKEISNAYLDLIKK